MKPIVPDPLTPLGMYPSVRHPNLLLVELAHIPPFRPFNKSPMELFFPALLKMCWRTRCRCKIWVGAAGVAILGNGDCGITLGRLFLYALFGKERTGR
eukprot:4250971-Ditylum_brightwellii.AAC.1